MNKVFKDLVSNYKNGGVVQKLIFWNIGVSVLMFVLEFLFSSLYSIVFPWFVLSGNLSSTVLKPWTLLTYAFVHAGVIHLIFNLIVLFFVGQLFNTYFTSKQFLTVYLLGAVFGGLFFIIGTQFLNTSSVLVGASAAVMAPLIGLAVFSPRMNVRLALIGNVQLWHIALFIIVLDVIQLSTSNVGGHLAHLGGAISGVLYIKLLQSGLDLSIIFDRIANLFKPKKGTNFKKVYVNKDPKKNKQSFTQEGSKQEKIDSILDKISKSGYESLTKEEKDFLFRAGK
ncbi:rhomboid family protein [Myroides phaeus]|uniref:Membrane associated serine protease, rhomboid family n=1 Tax=Myroides phaeus TaxID=702745 RepID=A0A1G8F8M9_9FLAO|nr:rhomboid family intramembrane serine protease [Myroides phaeus]SDH78359.1 Membrane associated serine protease, rhomboid family [Myroides phaeus]